MCATTDPVGTTGKFSCALLCVCSLRKEIYAVTLIEKTVSAKYLFITVL